jgi:hypothetical protein
MNCLSKVSSVQYPLEPPQVCILHHCWMPPWVHRFPMRHHRQPSQGPRHHINSTTLEFTSLQSLQGKANILCHFVPDYATRAHGFLRFLRHNIPFKWVEHAQTTFDDLKATLSNAPLISPPDYDRDYIL